jgi:uncharacterized protein
MNSIIRALALVVAGSSLQDPPAIARYVPSAPDPRHVFVMDSAHVLSESTIAALQDSAKALQAETGADIAWVTLPTLGGRAIEEATVYLGRTWKIGSSGDAGDPARNRGLVILYVPDKSKTAGSNFRVEVGKGLQETIIDSRSRSISAAMRDDLRAKRYDAGYLKGWTVAAVMVREDFANLGKPAASAPSDRADSAKDSHVAGVVILVAFLAVGLLLIFVFSRRSTAAGAPVMFLPTSDDDDDDDRRRRRRDNDSSSSWSSDDSGSSGASDSGGDFGGGGGFDGGGSSDSI